MARDVVPADVADISIDEILAIKHPDPPRWSPDGRWLAWRWDDGGQVSLWVSRSDGSGQKQVSQGEASVGAFDWSPDGRLAFSQDTDIWIAQPNGNHPSQITRGQSNDSAPRWSPVGERLAFVRNGGLIIHDFDAKCLTTCELPGKVAAGYADSISVRWSPDGERLASGVVCGTQRDLVVVNRSGEMIWRTDTPDDEAAFAWVDGQQLHVTQVDPTTRFRVHSLVNVDSGQMRELVREDSHKGLKGELSPVVRPGGAGIAYI
ncbi:MAG: hypothetical protein WBW04_18285, partial [Nitrolancea sp.]